MTILGYIFFIKLGKFANNNSNRDHNKVHRDNGEWFTALYS
jgi:hypothetical protein